MSLQKGLRKLEKSGLIYYELEDHCNNRRLTSCRTVKETETGVIWKRGLVMLAIILLVTPLFFNDSQDAQPCSEDIKSGYSGFISRGEFFRALDLQREYPALINTQDEYGWSALHWAVFYGRKDIVELLKNRGIDTELRTVKKWYIYKKGAKALEIKGFRKLF